MFRPLPRDFQGPVVGIQDSAEAINLFDTYNILKYSIKRLVLHFPFKL